MMVNTTTHASPNFYSGHSARTLIGIHTMEAPEAGTTAENVAAYFGHASTAASAHWCVDNNSRVRCVEDDNSAWTMPPTNRYSLNIEMAGYAGQSETQWDDAYSNEVLDIAALCASEWCAKYDIPVRHLTDSQIAAGSKGFAGHVDVNRVFHASSHTDPGPHFPWDKFLGMVRHHLGSVPVTTPPPSGKKDCTELQRALRTAPDNQWGANTDQHAVAVISSTQFGGETFPYGIAFTQGCVGAKQDGAWGPESKLALAGTVRKVQQSLKDMGFNPGAIDGIWGVNTDKAYRAARNACISS
jgi:N-acetyl-anhydromuramyl-L-alanine amidase AmpD